MASCSAGVGRCEGGLVALPTETVYGLAADAENELAVRQIFAVKGRPATHPLIVHLPGERSLHRFAREVPDVAQRLAHAFWPGPLTLVLPKTARVSHVVTGGQDTVGLRVPSHPLAQRVLQAFDGGLAAPSANRFGRVSPTTAEHVGKDLGADVDYVLDGGPLQRRRGVHHLSAAPPRHGHPDGSHLGTELPEAPPGG